MSLEALTNYGHITLERKSVESWGNLLTHWFFEWDEKINGKEYLIIEKSTQKWQINQYSWSSTDPIWPSWRGECWPTLPAKLVIHTTQSCDASAIRVWWGRENRDTNQYMPQSISKVVPSSPYPIRKHGSCTPSIDNAGKGSLAWLRFARIYHRSGIWTIGAWDLLEARKGPRVRPRLRSCAKLFSDACRMAHAPATSALILSTHWPWSIPTREGIAWDRDQTTIRAAICRQTYRWSRRIGAYTSHSSLLWLDTLALKENRVSWPLDHPACRRPLKR